MIEERSPEGSKRSAFYSVTTSRGGEETGWVTDDLKVVRCLLAKHVVSATYDDAVKRRVMTGTRAKEECLAILAAYDNQIVKHLANGNGE